LYKPASQPYSAGGNITVGFEGGNYADVPGSSNCQMAKTVLMVIEAFSQR